MASVILERVVKRYSGNPVPTIKELNLVVNDGEFMVFVGPSGCGKSTLLRMIAGLVTTTGGRIHIGGRDITELPPKERDISMVFQNYALFPHMSVYENIGFGLSIRKVDRKEIDMRVNEAAELLGLKNFLHKKPKDLSGGQRQRVALGRAIVRRPKVFLFDEPLSNLDAKLRTQMRSEISKLHKKLNTTMIYVTHDQCDAMTMADRMVVLSNGVIQQLGTPGDIYSSPKNAFVATFIGTPPMNLFRGKILEKSGTSFFTAGSFQMIIPERFCKFSDASSDECILGIRPEHIYLVQNKPPQITCSDIFECEVELAESMGNEICLHCVMGDVRFQSTQKHDFPIRTGDKIELVFDVNKIHVFNRNGQSLL